MGYLLYDRVILSVILLGVAAAGGIIGGITY